MLSSFYSMWLIPLRLEPSFFSSYCVHRDLHSFPTRRSSDLITHAYSIVIGSKHITLNATDNNTVGMGEDRKSGSAGMPRPISYAVFCLKKKNNFPNLFRLVFYRLFARPCPRTDSSATIS